MMNQYLHQHVDLRINSSSVSRILWLDVLGFCQCKKQIAPLLLSQCTHTFLSTCLLFRTNMAQALLSLTHSFQLLFTDRKKNLFSLSLNPCNSNSRPGSHLSCSNALGQCFSRYLFLTNVQKTCTILSLLFLS